MVVDKDMYMQWLEHPCTKDLSRQLEERRSQLINGLLGGTFIYCKGLDPAAVCSRDSGIATAYDAILNVISKGIYKEKEDSKDV